MLEQRRHGAHRQRGGRERRDVETERFQRGLFRFRCGDIQRVGIKAHRNQQRLRGDLFGVQCGLEFLVHDALVRGVHVHHHQPVRILREDVDAGELREGETERRDWGVGSRKR